MNMNDLNNGNNNQENINNVVPQVNNNGVNNQSINQDVNNNYVSANSLPTDSKNVAKEKKNKIIIIGAILVIILIIVLIVLSNTKGKDNDKVPNSNNDTNKTSENKEDEDESNIDDKEIYYYEVTQGDRKNMIASYISYKDFQDYTYKEITRYKCKGKCAFEATNSYNGTSAAFYIVDDDKIYEYDQENNKFNEVLFDRDIKGKDVTFKLSSSKIAIYNDESLNISTDKVYLGGSKDVDLNGVKTQKYEEIVTNIDILKDDIYVIRDDYKEYQIYKVYKGSTMLAEIKEKDGPELNSIKNYENYIAIESSTRKNIIVSKNGNVQKNSLKSGYSIYNGNLIISNENGNVEVYDSDKMVSSYDSSASRIAGRSYAVVMKDNKLLLYDALSNKVIRDFGSVKDTEKFIDTKYTPSIGFSDTNERYMVVTIFLEDTSIPRENDRAFGRYFVYNLSDDSLSIDDHFSRVVS